MQNLNEITETAWFKKSIDICSHYNYTCNENV
jgi:hypothetical protein